MEQTYTVEVSGKRFDVKVIGPPFAGGGVVNGSAPAGAARGRAPASRAARSAPVVAAGGGDTLASPIQGTVLKVAVEAGADVDEGALICRR